MINISQRKEMFDTHIMKEKYPHLKLTRALATRKNEIDKIMRYLSNEQKRSMSRINTGVKSKDFWLYRKIKKIYKIILINIISW